MNYIGELAALGTSLAFSFGSIFFSLAGRHLNAIVVNRTRVIIAAIFLSIAHWTILGSLLPLDADPQRWIWLSLSGVVGLVLGDIFLFQAFIWIGPRLSMLMMSLAPVFASLQAWIFLGEELSGGKIFGILLTLCGIAWVVLEDNETQNGGNLNYRRGILYGLGGALGQATGLVLAKNGMIGNFSPISGNVIRMLAAVVVMWGVALFQGQIRETIDKMRTNRPGMLYILVASFFGPFIGVSFSLLAVQRAEIGVASTLMALPPVLLMPISYFVFKERFGWRAILGTLLAMGGVALLFLV
ncbi:MAG: DMT family transporter [Chloroflexi bacterium]|nr:DMT family transporter [Chloroflexota bacterium]